MNGHHFLRDPESTELGKRILSGSVKLIHELGFESFTFKKLAEELNTKEASIYRYFENKHRVLTYLLAWYWSWLEYQVIFHTHNLTDADQKLKAVLQIITHSIADDTASYQHIDKKLLREILISEEAKAYLTKHVNEDNKVRLFKPLKDLAGRMAHIIAEISPSYPYPHSLSSTLLEAAHQQMYFTRHLPSLTDFTWPQAEDELCFYLEDVAFNTLHAHRTKQDQYQ